MREWDGRTSGTDRGLGRPALGKSELAGRRQALRALGSCLGLAVLAPVGALAELEERPIPYTSDEIVVSGHRFFGSVSRGLADVVQTATQRWGQPNGYVLGQEAGGALIGGLRYGEGKLYTQRGPGERLFWQGPSIGFDTGGDGDRTMMLIYNLPARSAIFQRFGGVDGSAYFVGGLGMTALTSDGMVVVPIRTGLGARLGVNVGYLKFTPVSTWNPF